MQEYIETYQTPDGRYTIVIEVDWSGQVISVIFEENDRESSIYE